MQVSKISFVGLFILVLLFQQLVVGSEASGSPNTGLSYLRKDTLQNPDSSKKVSFDTLGNLSLKADTNIAQDETLKSPVKYHARDSMQVNITDEIVYLFGEATVDYEDMHLKADYIVIDMNKKELFAEGLTDSVGIVTGSPEFSQSDQKFRSSSIRYNFDSKKGKIAYVITKEGEGYIHGEVVKKDQENNFFIKKGQYTTCDLDNPHFAITSNKLKVISKNKIITGPAYLTIEGVPTPLLLPFGFFPNKPGRSSGIIFPSFGESNERGFYFQKLGYYFGFNDYFNLAITSDVYTKGSYTLNGSSIYKKRYKYSGNVRLSYAYTIHSEKELPDYSIRRDYHINWKHSQDPKFSPNNTFTADVNAGSSTYFKNTNSTVNNFLSNTLQSSISFSHNFPDKPMNYNISIKHNQNNLTRQVQLTAPDFGFNITRINPFKRKLVIGRPQWYEKIGTSYTMKGINYIDTKDTLLFRKESLDNLQTGFQHFIPLSTSFNVMSYFNLSPSISYTERWYLKTTQLNWNKELKKIDTSEVKKFKSARDYAASIGLSTRIFGMYQFSHGPITAIRHVMSPSASFSFRPDFGTDNYGYYKNVQKDTLGTISRYSIFQNSIYGGPSRGRYASINFNLDNNLEMKVKTNSDTGATVKKIKLLENLNFSTSYNLLADSMKLSLINVNGRTSLFDRVSLKFGGVLDPYSFDEKNIDYDKFSVTEGGRLARLTSANISVDFSLNKKEDKNNARYSKEELDYINLHPEEYVDFNIPYNLSVSYSYRYNKQGSLPKTTTQSASFNGDLSLTPQWKIGFNSWYDVTEGKFTSLSLNIYRDLHCWEMRMNWIPFGYQESWNFQINVKASILQDLKLLKKKEFYDN